MNSLPPEVYPLILHETPNPTVVTDESFAIVDVNQACLEFTGYSREEMLGTLPLFLVNDPQTYEAMTARLAVGEPWEGELEAVTKSGERAYGRGTTFPLVDDGELVGYTGIFIDLSARRRSEQTVSVLNRVLRHNVRNDANVVGGVLSTVRDAVPAEERELVDQAIRRVDRLLERAETARDLHELLERSSSALVPVDLTATVEAVVDDVGGGGQATHAVRADEATFHLDLPDSPLWVLADEALPRAVGAVVENAVEYNDAEEATVWLSATATDAAVTLTVEDDGLGIDADRSEYLFGRTEESQLRHGQGLSLFFVDRLLAFYGGSVRYRPRDPTGSAFELRFRRTDSPAGD
ncbi:PAS domain-containing sensor histidine kinase [Halogeometricum sp. S1BR25-6]|uniref:histidine kinase n=1 Tax=Halogeometricum salsisoli TaxID=2950536 RepID=A0ABU2GI56_9EURY|nr:PAS domain-containing sensor histidine kinase [Halogeometricum sp. S1BR25-6]MDS0299874.1 PAS domain-containing sensor histidine kinase [Halogeometricum sp. S1BR25-6]